ncbi:hypothetical protein BDF22DRAFT_667064 [Syncephalis plumigaleata]|nr:hypothetical protein BDF22DRAFT_667064 [Syncephalis plumigaleata]
MIAALDAQLHLMMYHKTRGLQGKRLRKSLVHFLNQICIIIILLHVIVGINIHPVAARLQLSTGSQIYATSNYFQYTPSNTTKLSHNSIKGIILSTSFSSNCTINPWPVLSTNETATIAHGIVGANRTLVLIDPDAMLTAGCRSYKQTINTVLNSRMKLLDNGYPALAAVLITVESEEAQGPFASYCRTDTMEDIPCYKPPNLNGNVTIALLNTSDGRHAWNTIHSNARNTVTGILNQDAGPWNVYFATSDYAAITWLISCANAVILFIGFFRIFQLFLWKEFHFNCKNMAYSFVIISSACQIVYPPLKLLELTRGIFYIVGEITANLGLITLAVLWLIRLPYFSLIWRRCCYCMIAIASVLIMMTAIINMMNLPNLFNLQWLETIITSSANAASSLIYIVFFGSYGVAFYRKWCSYALSGQTRRAIRRLILLSVSQALTQLLLLLLTTLYSFKPLARRPTSLFYIIIFYQLVLILRSVSIIGFLRIRVTEEEMERNNASTESLRIKHPFSYGDERRPSVVAVSRRSIQGNHVNLSLLVDPNRPF